MKPFSGKLSRRSFLAFPALVPIAALDSGSRLGEHHFRYDYVIGTSLDLVVWTPDGVLAARAHEALQEEIRRLSMILNTRDPQSEIRRLAEPSRPARGSDLERVLSAYALWEKRSGGLLSSRPSGPGTRLDVDALGKAYILDRAVQAARAAVPAIDGLLLNIGGDIVLWGRFCEVSIADPRAPYDNAEPVTRIVLTNSAIATSGAYARGAHLLDPRTGTPVQSAPAATVVAPDALTANALATTLCVAGADDGMRLVESTPGAAALRIERGMVRRSAGFARLERAPAARPVALADWPRGYQLTVSLTLKEGDGALRARGRTAVERPFVAVWVQDATTRGLVRVLAFWADQPRYFTELSVFAHRMVRDAKVQASLARATRPAGKYQLVWDGLDEQRRPVPAGSYLIVVETNQWHGSYTKQSGAIACEAAPAEITLPATAQFEPVTIQYGPRPSQA
jgi:thiamine biosynthesis lipoprotein